jgi:hypothetical protein
MITVGYATSRRGKRVTILQSTEGYFTADEPTDVHLKLTTLGLKLLNQGYTLSLG